MTTTSRETDTAYVGASEEDAALNALYSDFNAANLIPIWVHSGIRFAALKTPPSTPCTPTSTPRT